MQIYCKNFDEYININGGVSLREIAEQLADRLPFRPIGALVNYKTEGLGYQLFGPKMVEFIPRNSEHGRRMYVRSLCMMLYKAVHDLCPGARLRIAHSMGYGYYCRLTGVECTSELVDSLFQYMRKLVAHDFPFVRRERLTSHVIQLFKEQGLDDKVKLLESLRSLYTVFYELDGVFDSLYGELAPSTGYIDVFKLLPYKEGFLLFSFDPANDTVPAPPSNLEKVKEAFDEYLRFNDVIGVRNVAELNQVVSKNKTKLLINVAEALHNKKIAAIADEIARRYHEGGAKIVLVAGPSSSGKTTFSKRLGIQLVTNLIVPCLISLDNYFVDRDRTPVDENGEYDYESLYAIDVERFNSDLSRLIAGETVTLPRYNFETGKNDPQGGETISLENNKILVIEGIHGLNPELTAQIAPEMKFKIYVSALTSLSIDDHSWIPTTDNRLLRRIIRDAKYRGTSASATIHRWASVRRGEEKWIFPFQENADSMFNSSLLFEVGVMRDYAYRLLRDIPHDVPEYSEAYRLLRFLASFSPILDDNIPSTSLLREFLGGSSFHY